MRIEDFLALLEPKRKRQDSQGSYICRCPAHDDSTESLHVKLGRNKYGKDIILVKCFAGCDREEIVRALGLTMKDLTVQPRAERDAPPWDESRVHQAKPTYERRDGALSGAALQLPQRGSQRDGSQLPQRGAREHGEKRLECAYPYTDEEGRLLYEAVRYRYEDGSKTFRQRRPDPAKPGNWLWDTKNVRLVLYRLPDVIRAIREKRPIWIAEGEKDADSLGRLGLVGTTSPMGAGKWNKGNYSPSLDGAICYILPDNDKPGWDHALEVARALEGHAAHVRILDLKRIWPELPEKGDVSDLIAHLGDEQAKEKLLALSQDNSVQYADLEGIYARVYGYLAAGGRICQSTDSGPKPLCNFLALPVEVLTIDDGITIQKRLTIRGWRADGKELPPARVPVEKFPGMGWVTENWDISANMSPGNTVKDKLRYAIAEAGRATVTRRSEYIHTGWRKLQGKWAYLHSGGAIGAAHVNTALEGALSLYNLDSEAPIPEGYRASRNLTQVMSRHVAVPLLACMYLAPLRNFLKSAGIPPGFALFLVGKGGGRKSTAAALALSHFGNFSAKTPVASFHDTANSVRRKAFCLQDMPLLIDDYHPTSSPQERRRMEGMAQELARAFGDMADRSRMNADRTLQSAQPPRCLAVMTGEDMPQIGESGVARFFVIRVQGDEDVPITDALTQAQDGAASGLLRSAMRGYIQYLLPQAETLPENLKTEWMRLRAEARKRLPKGSHARSGEALAHLMLGWEMMLMYGYSLGEIEKDALPDEIEAAWRELTQAGSQQAREAKEDTPENGFLSCVAELLTSKAYFAVDLTITADKGPTGGPNMLGWADMEYYYLLPDLAYRAVCETYTRQGTGFPLSKRGLMRALKETNLSDAEDGGVTRTRRIGNRTLRLLWIPRHLIDGGPPPAEQIGFTDVTGDEDDPFRHSKN